MITKFKLFENHEDIDPYGEENWFDKMHSLEDIAVGDRICNTETPEAYGDIKEIGDMIKLSDDDSTWYVDHHELLGWLDMRLCRVIKKDDIN